MVSQYDHFLFVRTLYADSEQDDKGGWKILDCDWTFHTVCREETNGKGTVINTTDGRTLVFSSLAFMPKGTPRISEGTTVLISETNDPKGIIRIRGQVLKFDNNQLHCRLWL